MPVRVNSYFSYVQFITIFFNDNLFVFFLQMNDNNSYKRNIVSVKK